MNKRAENAFHCRFLYMPGKQNKMYAQGMILIDNFIGYDRK
jgi:hypothetical protein